jgi:hypothetical protein
VRPIGGKICSSCLDLRRFGLDLFAFALNFICARLDLFKRGEGIFSFCVYLRGGCNACFYVLGMHFFEGIVKFHDII